MADEQIQILIKAVDETTATVKRIEQSVNGMAKESKKQTESLGQSFTKLQGNLLVLGNAAASVDRIFSSYTNMQLRLENATERVANAQDRLADAQKRLTRLHESGTASAEDLEDAQDEVTRATRGLTISQNNLARANNAVIGTWINMGLQTVTVIGSIPTLIKSVVGMTVSLWGMVPALTAVTVAGFPLWVIILAIIAAITAIVLVVKNWKSIMEFLAPVFQWFMDNILMPFWTIITEIWKWLEFFLLPLFIYWKLIITLLGEAFKWLLDNVLKPVYEWLKDPFLMMLEKIINAVKWLIDNIGKLTSLGNVISNAYNAIANKRDQVTASVKGKVNDGIIKPDGSIIKTNPQDTLVAMKNPSLSTAGLGGNGITIVINGDNYGVNAKAIAEELYDQIRRKISI